MTRRNARAREATPDAGHPNPMTKRQHAIKAIPDAEAKNPMTMESSRKTLPATEADT
jgi:hypothetical protein